MTTAAVANPVASVVVPPVFPLFRILLANPALCIYCDRPLVIGDAVLRDRDDWVYCSPTCVARCHGDRNSDMGMGTTYRAETFVEVLTRASRVLFTRTTPDEQGPLPFAFVEHVVEADDARCGECASLLPLGAPAFGDDFAANSVCSRRCAFHRLDEAIHYCPDDVRPWVDAGAPDEPLDGSAPFASLYREPAHEDYRDDDMLDELDARGIVLPETADACAAFLQERIADDNDATPVIAHLTDAERGEFRLAFPNGRIFIVTVRSA